MEILRRIKPRLQGRYPLSRLALFGSTARDEASEGSDIDVLVEVDPSIGLRFVDLAAEIEEALGHPADVVSRRAMTTRVGKQSSRSWPMPKRDPVLLVGDIRACLRQVAEYIRGMDLDAFRSDRKTIDAVTRNLEIIGEAARQLTEADRGDFTNLVA